MDDRSFHEIDRVGDFTIGDSGEQICIVTGAPYGWKISRLTVREAERACRALRDAIGYARLTQHANAGYPDTRPSREECA